MVDSSNSESWTPIGEASRTRRLLVASLASPLTARNLEVRRWNLMGAHPTYCGRQLMGYYEGAEDAEGAMPKKCNAFRIFGAFDEYQPWSPAACLSLSRAQCEGIRFSSNHGSFFRPIPGDRSFLELATPTPRRRWEMATISCCHPRIQLLHEAWKI